MRWMRRVEIPEFFVFIPRLPDPLEPAWQHFGRVVEERELIAHLVVGAHVRQVVAPATRQLHLAVAHTPIIREPHIVAHHHRRHEWLRRIDPILRRLPVRDQTRSNRAVAATALHAEIAEVKQIRIQQNLVGKAVPNVLARVKRGDETLAEVEIVKVQRQQQEAKEVFEGEMCGLSIKTAKKLLLEEGDKLEFFTRELVKRTLK